MHNLATARIFHDVRRIVVLRGGGIGDLIFALPALEALKHRYPDAELRLIGTAAHRALLTELDSPVDAVELLPGIPGVKGGSQPECSAAEQAEFIERMRAHRFDLAVQLHGGGRFSNPLLLQFGARHTIGARTPDAAELERSIPYLYYQHEVMRGLEIVAQAGAEPVVLEPRLGLRTPGSGAAESILEGGASALVAIHPGATDPRRRWPVDRFAEVAAGLAGDGVRVVVVGDAGDVGAGEQIVAGAEQLGAPRGAVFSLAGRLSLRASAELLAGVHVMLGNDSGPRHLAGALGTATVGLFWFGNALNGAPFTRQRHRLQLSWTTHCPVCGVDVTQVGWTAKRCEHDDSFVADIAVEPVLADVRELLESRVTATSPLPSDTPPARGSRIPQAG